MIFSDFIAGSFNTSSINNLALRFALFINRKISPIVKFISTHYALMMAKLAHGQAKKNDPTRNEPKLHVGHSLF